MNRRRVAVVGGGIAGLTAAYDLSRAHDPDELEVVVLEASDRFGGKLHTTEFLGHPVDAGADSFLARVPDAVALCHELGLDDELVTPAVRRAFLLRGGALAPFPDGLVLGVPTDLDALERSGLISPAGIERARRDLTDPAPPRHEDESVGSLVRRRLGDEVFETLVSPLLSGVNAGDADRLSLDAGAAQLAAASRPGGSLVAVLREQIATARRDPDAPIFHSLAAGTGRLVDALLAALDAHGGVDIRRGVTVTGLHRADDRYRISTRPTRTTPTTRTAGSEPHWWGSEPAVRDSAGWDSGNDLEVDAAVVATPAFVSGELLGGIEPTVAAGLAELEYASVVVVTLGYERRAIGHALDGSGFLVPESEGLLLTACSWGSAKWPQWSDTDHVVLRLSAGRHHDRRSLDLDDDELVGTLADEITGPMAITAPPLATRVTRWPRALPQYRPGHLDRVAAWEAELDESAPGVVLAGASGRGLGIPACIASGRAAAARLLEFDERSPRRG